MAKPKSPAEMSESDIEKKLRDYAKARGVLTRKFTSPGTFGVPDRLFIFPNGFTVYVELKRLGELPTPNQWRQIKEFREARAHVYVVDSLEEGKRMIDVMLSEGPYAPIKAFLGVPWFYSDPAKLIADGAKYGVTV